MRTLRLIAIGLLSVAMASPAVRAQDISSNDGLWRATLDAFDPSGGVGQITNLFTPSAGSDNLFETLWYEAIDGGLSSRVENNYTNTGSVVGADFATFSAVRNDGIFGLDVSISMLDGAGGGAVFALTWTNLDSAPHTHKAFAYADMDIEASAGGDDAFWTGSAVNQHDRATSLFFGNTEGYKGWEIDTFSGLRAALDGGVSNLANAGGGLNADWTAAVSGFERELNPGESYTFTFSFNAVPAPGALALLGIAGLAGTRRRRM